MQYFYRSIIAMSESRVKTWSEIKGKGADLVIDKQAELRKKDGVKKKLGIVINVLLNEYAEFLEKQK